MSAKKQNPIALAKSSRRSASKPPNASASRRKRTGIPRGLPEQRPTEDSLRKLNRTYALLSDVNQAIVRVREPQALFEAACRIAVEQGGFRMAWIGLLDPQTKQVRPAAHAGETDGYLDKLNIVLDDSERGRGPTATALRAGEPVVVNDIASDPRMAPWRADALRLGYRASAAFPLIVAREVRGALNLYAPESDFFDEDELKLLDEMAADIAFALEFAEQEEQRKRAEEALRESEEKFSAAFHSSPLTLVITTFGGRYVEANRAFCDLVGYSREEIIGKTVTDLGILGVQDRERLVAAIESSGGSVSNAEVKFRVRDGGMRDIIYSLETISLSGVPHRLSTGLDITDRKRAEQALRESEQKFSILFEKAAFSAALSRLPEGVIVDVNEAFERAFGYTKEEAAGKTSLELGVNPDSESRARIIAVLQTQGSARDIELTLRTKSGVARVFLVNIDLVDIGGQKYILQTAQDITERKQAEEALRSKNEEIKIMSQQMWQAARLATMGELAASVAHELNNPLATVSLRTEMLLAQFPPEDPKARPLQIIESEVKRMSDLVANLLQFSRRSQSIISTTDVREEIIKTLDFIQHHLRNRQITVVQEFASKTPLIHADRQQLRQVFLNLFINASDAMPKGGTLTIRIREDQGDGAQGQKLNQSHLTGTMGTPVAAPPYLVIEVADTGEGIPVEVLTRIWEPFYTTKPEGKGTGLGLGICQRIVQEHSGRIEIMSEGIPGNGTTVRIVFPANKDGDENVAA